MDLTLSRRGDYVVRAAICLAAAWDGQGAYCKIRQVAEAMDLPRSYTPQILGILAKAGLAEAKAGRDGGYRLTRPPEGISLLEVIEAAEGYLVSERCPLRGGPCHWDDVCALHPTWVKASEAVRNTLTMTTLAQVAAADRDLLAGQLVQSRPAGHRTVTRRRREAKRAAQATRG
jgi:Rrf2 family protein